MRAAGATEPARCLFVGDRLFDDVWGAQNVGMRAVHIPHSAIPANQIGHTVGEPDATIQRLSELPEIIDGWNKTAA
jgi:putative hydrolase of the HAD superfamily